MVETDQRCSILQTCDDNLLDAGGLGTRQDHVHVILRGKVRRATSLRCEREGEQKKQKGTLHCASACRGSCRRTLGP
jgi:hypothetical protein